jgi:hypothetical protein
MDKLDTDFWVAVGGITAPIWVTSLTDWFGLFAAAGAALLVVIRIYKNMKK